MNKDELVAALRDCGALRFGRFVLASGRQSDYYVDVKQAATRPDLLRSLARALAGEIPTCDRLAAVELGAIPLVAAVALETNVPYVMVRKETKVHGTRRPYEGALEEGDRVVFVEDVVTTGGTLRRAIERLRDVGAVVETAVAVVDRDEGGREGLAAAGVELRALLAAKDLRGASP
jgi:orotate phosphoribosyltransferase